MLHGPQSSGRCRGIVKARCSSTWMPQRATRCMRILVRPMPGSNAEGYERVRVGPRRQKSILPGVSRRASTKPRLLSQARAPSRCPPLASRQRPHLWLRPTTATTCPGLDGSGRWRAHARRRLSGGKRTPTRYITRPEAYGYNPVDNYNSQATSVSSTRATKSSALFERQGHCAPRSQASQRWPGNPGRRSFVLLLLAAGAVRVHLYTQGYASYPTQESVVEASVRRYRERFELFRFVDVSSDKSTMPCAGVVSDSDVAIDGMDKSMSKLHGA